MTALLAVGLLPFEVVDRRGDGVTPLFARTHGVDDVAADLSRRVVAGGELLHQIAHFEQRAHDAPFPTRPRAMATWQATIPPLNGSRSGSITCSWNR